MLTTPFDHDEFKRGIFQIHNNKSLGPDECNPTFYKIFWDILGVDIYNIVTIWLDQGVFPPNLNNVDIVLIPKKDNLTSMLDLRPISLCNALYKIVSKVHANRLKVLLPKCISQEQSTLVEGCSIIDSVLVAIETIHHMKCKVNGRTSEFALKIDISKSFDKVE